MEETAATEAVKDVSESTANANTNEAASTTEEPTSLDEANEVAATEFFAKRVTARIGSEVLHVASGAHFNGTRNTPKQLSLGAPHQVDRLDTHLATLDPHSSQPHGSGARSAEASAGIDILRDMYLSMAKMHVSWTCINNIPKDVKVMLQAQ